MINAHVKTPTPCNEPVLSYAPGKPERRLIKDELEAMLRREIEIPLLIGG